MLASKRFWATVFIVASGMDLFLTWLLMSQGDFVYEANPLAAGILHAYGWWGLSAFKGLAVLFVVGIGVGIGIRHPRSSLRMFRICSALVVAIVIYSGALYASTSDAEGRQCLAEETLRGEQLEQRRQDYQHFLSKIDELAQELIARNLGLREAAATLQETLDAIDYNPFPGLRINCGDSMSNEACLAAQLVRQVGFLLRTDPMARCETMIRLADEFNVFESPLPEYGSEPFQSAEE